MFLARHISVCAILSLSPSGASERDEVFAEYATIKTIAGLGEDEDGNFWKANFEGVLATEIELSNPHMTMADVAGNYYIADKESHSVLKVDPDGRVHTHAGTHVGGYNGDAGLATEIQLNNPNGLFVRSDGVVYILDFFNQRIRKVDTQGNLTTLVHHTDGFGPGRGLWVSADERLIYFNGFSQVKQWTPEGGVDVVVNAIADPGNLTVDPDGNLVVTSRGDHRVYRVGEEGALTVIAGDGTDGESTGDGIPATSVGLESARSVAFLPNGAFFVATQKGGDVWFVDTAGLIYKFVGGKRSGNVRAGDGQLFSTPGDKISEPRAISLAPNGDLIITTNDKGFVRIVERFQTPTLTALREQGWRVEVTAGREHHLEISSDLRGWNRWRSLAPEEVSDTATDLFEGSAFLRVSW